MGLVAFDELTLANSVHPQGLDYVIIVSVCTDKVKLRRVALILRGLGLVCLGAWLARSLGAGFRFGCWLRC